MTLDKILSWYFELLHVGESIPLATLFSSQCRCRGVRVPGEKCPACDGSGTVLELRMGGSDVHSSISDHMVRRCEVGQLLSVLSRREYLAVQTKIMAELALQHHKRHGISDSRAASAYLRRDGAGEHVHLIAELTARSGRYDQAAADMGHLAAIIERSEVYRSARRKLTVRLGMRRVA